MDSLLAVPEPGIAIFPQYISSNIQKINLKGSSWSKSMTATSANGQALFRIQSETLSRSYRKTVIDGSTNSTLYQIRREDPGTGTRRYYAQSSDTGPRLFETEARTRLMHQSQIVVTLTNQADASHPTAELGFTPASRGKTGNFLLNGEEVVIVEQVSLNVGGEYELTVAAGLDPALIVGVMVAMVDQMKTQFNSGAGAAATTGAAGIAAGSAGIAG